MSDLKSPRPVFVRRLGLQDYRVVFEAMQSFTSTRLPATPDELWLLEHYPVFTLGLNGKPEHLLAPGDIPVIRADRGGQVTYHGPGQLVVYLLMDVKRARLGVRALITALEQSVIQLLAGFAVRAYSRAEAPGVYVEAAKVASVGMRIRRGCSYHGLSLNVAMDLEPFARINPCGYAGLRVTQLQDLGIKAGLADIAERLSAILVKDLGYTHCQAADSLPPLPYLETRHA